MIVYVVVQQERKFNHDGMQSCDVTIPGVFTNKEEAEKACALVNRQGSGDEFFAEVIAKVLDSVQAKNIRLVYVAWLYLRTGKVVEVGEVLQSAAPDCTSPLWDGETWLVAGVSSESEGAAIEAARDRGRKILALRAAGGWSGIDFGAARVREY